MANIKGTLQQQILKKKKLPKRLSFSLSQDYSMQQKMKRKKGYPQFVQVTRVWHACMQIDRLKNFSSLFCFCVLSHIMVTLELL